MIQNKVEIRPPRGVLGIFTDRGQRSILGGFEFRKSVFFGYCSHLLYFCGLLDKALLLCVLYFLTICFWLKFYAPGVSVITVRHCYHIMLNFCQMSSVFGGYFLEFCFPESIFWVFCQWQSPSKRFLQICRNYVFTTVVLQSYPFLHVDECRKV